MYRTNHFWFYLKKKKKKVKKVKNIYKYRTFYIIIIRVIFKLEDDLYYKNLQC
jgi:hypothetical protein